VLILVSGLPGAGKSSLAEDLGRVMPAPVLFVDAVEAAMRRAGVGRDQPIGLAAYVVVEAVADGVLALRQTAIIEAVNDVEAAREQWRGLACRHGVRLRFIQVTCSDRDLHRQRLERRRRRIEGLDEPNWTSVEARREGFAEWTEDRLVLDFTPVLVQRTLGSLSPS
jgi:predicted kinase